MRSRLARGCALLASYGVVAATTPAPVGAMLSAGFTSDMVLKQAPQQAAIYGLVYSSAAGVWPVISVVVDGVTVATATATSNAQGSGTDCDKRCWDAGYLSSAGAISPCQLPSCSMGCLMAARTPSKAACEAQCVNASGKCEYSIATGSTWPLALDLCEGVLAGGCPAKDECQAGCANTFDLALQPLAWKALLPATAGGGPHTVSVHCASGCPAGAADPPPLERVAFGEVFYCSGQSNMALGLQYTYLWANVSAGARAGAYANIKFYQFGGMSYQNDADAPVYATTSMSYPLWPWQNLTQAMTWGKGTGRDEVQALGSLSATCFYFAKALTDSLGAAAPAIGLITNAVGGTTIAAWSDPADLASCPNSTDTGSAAPPWVLYNGMAAPFFNTTVSGFVWLQGENDCGGTMGNSALGFGYACALPKMVATYRRHWSSVPGTTDELAPFGIVTLAAGTSEGNGKNMALMRFAQTGGHGVLPNKVLPNTFLAQAYDLSDPWQSYDCDGQHCSVVDPATGKFGPECVSPWTNLSLWDTALSPLAPLVRLDNTSSFMGGIHPRIKPPVGWRLAQAYLNRPAGGSGSAAFTGPTIAGCAVNSAAGTITVAFNATLLRGEHVAVAPFNINTTSWGVRDSLYFMACFSSVSGGADCLDSTKLDLWRPCAARAGADGVSVVLSVPPPPPAGGGLAALRFAWPLSDEGDSCCVEKASTSGHQACVPGLCGVKGSASLLPANSFFATLTAAGTCMCLAPQVCDASVAT